MDKDFQNIVDELNGLAEAINGAWSESKVLAETWGSNYPAITKSHLVDLVKGLAGKIKECDPENKCGMSEAYLKQVVYRIQIMKNTMVPSMFNGSGGGAVISCIVTIYQMDSVLSKYITWVEPPDKRLMPSSMLRRVRAGQERLSKVVQEIDDLDERIERIQAATDAADSLPTDLAELKAARDEIESISSSMVLNGQKIGMVMQEVDQALEYIVEKKEESERLIDQCEEAYRITTTKGLAASFDERAKQLNNSVWWWVVILLTSLAIGAGIGIWRISVLSLELAGDEPKWSIVLMHMSLSFVSVGGPVWVAWLSTKQIGQRFRLAEDYGFKSAVAKAYEGYRREAARIDEVFEARLFSSALSRLDEAPLRLVEQPSHGSPWHELINSDSFGRALQMLPDLKDKFISIVKKTTEQYKQKENGDMSD